MKWGVALNVRDSVSETVRKAKIADTGGLDQVWVTDFPAARYAPALAAAIAENTISCRIGVGLVSPLLYSTTQIIQFMSTLIDTYGERFDLLIGPGDRHALARVGVTVPAKLIVDKTTRILEDVKQELSEAGRSCTTLLGAQGPRMIRASLKADGVLLNYSDLEMVTWALDQIKNDIEDDFQLGVFPPTFVGNCQDIESNQGISFSAAMVAIGLNKVISESFGLSGQIETAKNLLKNREQIDQEIIKSLGEDVLRRFAFCGSSDDLSEYMKALRRLGISSVVFGPPQGVRKRGVDILVKEKSNYDMS